MARTPGGATVSHDLDKHHLPAGPVSLAAVVRMLIEEFGAEARGDWPKRLARAEEQLPSPG